MKVTTDSCLFGSWISEQLHSGEGRPNKTVLDIGTGTGLLSLMIAQGNPGMTLSAVEIDGEAAREAKENVDASPWGDRVRVIHTNILEWDATGMHDIIISNPPFYENELRSPNAQRNKAHHSSHLTLGQLLGTIAKFLAPGGLFYLLLPYKRKEELREQFSKAKLSISRICLVRQTPGHDYFRMMVEGCRQPVPEIGFDEMVIKETNGDYSAEFMRLLKPFYLKL
jgi:tRNA1Val (adenine37-N6)-methyltransferase